MVNIHYALQTYDNGNNQSNKRYCADTKAEVTQKCVTSFFESVYYCAKERDSSNHVIMIFDDGSTQETVDLLFRLKEKYNQVENITVEIEQRVSTGIMDSIRNCWNWLEKNGIDLVYQVQDDYLYDESCIFEMVDVFMQLNIDVETHAIVIPYNDPHHWVSEKTYRYRPTPRTIIHGAYRYWIQIYDIPCTFLTSKQQFSRHWDLYERFLQKSPVAEDLESDSLNYIFTKRGVLGVSPVTSAALHMQSEQEKDPYIDWTIRWNSVKKV